VHEPLPLTLYLNGLWSRRGYARFVSISELRNRQMTSVLGNLWHLLNPILQVGVYYLVFGLVLSTAGRGPNYILFLVVGVFIFSDTQRAVMAGANSIVNNRGILQALSFPRALLPITSTVTESLATAPSVLVVYVSALLTGETPSLRWLLFPAVILVQFLFNLGFSLLAARATTHFHDLQQILPFVFRILLYLSGVIFSVEALGSPDTEWVFHINPIYAFISIARWTVMEGELQMIWLASAAGWTLTLLIVGFVWFRAAEERYGRD